MRIKLAVIAMISLLLWPASAAAHVLVPSTKGESGAVLHVTPDDDPAAGLVTGIYYDVKAATNLKGAKAALHITKQNGGIDATIPVQVDGQTAAASFIFPIRGVYYLTLIVSTPSGTTSFPSYLRIDHSAVAVNPAPVIPLWALLGLVGSAWALLVLVGLAIKHRSH